ncbi:Rho GTPase activation protein [Mucidula mucida]|nr:Rho GTPase activation protein [Mucidula mucida]
MSRMETQTRARPRKMPPTTLTLKQRLAALSAAPSAPASPTNYSHQSYVEAESPKRRSFFNTPWNMKSRSYTDGTTHELNKVQDVMGKLIFQAGVDFETRPMVVLNASALPDPHEVNYDLLLSRVLSYLNLYVEADYTVVFFAAGSRHTPGWNWVWKAYRGLNRNYRKNLKRLFIVHSTFFTKMLFSLAGAIISPKFFRKIAYMDTLTELAAQVPITQIDIPPAVYQENNKHEKKIILPIPISSSTFGVPLADLMGASGENSALPRPIKDAIQYLRETGLYEEGLFRRSPSSALLRAAQDAYDRGNVVNLETFGDQHLAAVLIKKFLRDLPEPVFGEEMYAVIRRCPEVKSDLADMAAVRYVREAILPDLEPCMYILLSAVLHLMHEVSLRAASNRMDAHNLAVVLTPNLVKSNNPTKDVMMCGVPGAPALYPNASSPNRAALSENRTTLGSVIKLCIQRYYEIFDEVRDRSEAVPPKVSNRISTGSVGDPRYILGEDEEEDSIDDGMLVMPIGPSHGHGHHGARCASGFKPRHRSTLSNGSSQDVKSRSVISIENGSSFGGMGRVRGGVEAIGITAEGFFSAPVPPSPVKATHDAS